MGGLRQEAIWRSGTDAEVFGWLHASGRPEQSPSGEAPGRPRHFHLEGLRRRLPAQGDDAGRSGIRSPVRPAHHTQSFGADSAVRASGPPRPFSAVSALPVLAGGRSGTDASPRERAPATGGGT